MDNTNDQTGKYLVMGGLAIVGLVILYPLISSIGSIGNAVGSIGNGAGSILGSLNDGLKSFGSGVKSAAHDVYHDASKIWPWNW